jgi:hypothetical protein
VHGRLILDQIKNAKLVPDGADQNRAEWSPTFSSSKKNSTLDLRQVQPGQKTGRRLDRDRERRSSRAKTVVVRGQLQLAPGTQVVVKEEAAPPNEAGGPDPNAVP